MDAMTLSPSENGTVSKIYQLFEQNGMEKEKTEVAELLQHIGHMEMQFEKVFDELQNVRSQLESLQDKGVKATVMRIADTAIVKVTEARTQLTAIKDGVLRSLSNTVESVKEKGISALSKTMDFFKIHSALSILKGKLDGAVQSLGRGVEQIEQIKTELHAAKSHTRNAGRLFFGKETKETAYDSKHGVLAGIQTMLGKTGGLLEGIRKSTDSAMRKIEGLGSQEKPGSVKDFIKERRQAQADANRSAPVRETAR